MDEIDKTDLRLLSALQANAKTPVAKLAEVCSASTSSIQRRLRRLRDAGVIERDTIEISRHKAGFVVKAVVSVKLERDREAETTAFQRKAAKNPNVQHCYCVAGEADFMLIVVAKNMEAYEAFAQRFFVADPSIQKFRTSLVISEQKASNALPIM